MVTSECWEPGPGQREERVRLIRSTLTLWEIHLYISGSNELKLTPLFNSCHPVNLTFWLHEELKKC